jgi:hypothetical protein
MKLEYRRITEIKQFLNDISQKINFWCEGLLFILVFSVLTQMYGKYEEFCVVFLGSSEDKCMANMKSFVWFSWDPRKWFKICLDKSVYFIKLLMYQFSVE